MRGFWFELASNIAAEASAVHTLFLLHSAARPRSPFPEVQSISSGLFPSNASAVVKRNTFDPAPPVRAFVASTMV